MNANQRLDYLVKLDEKLLKGGVITSEKSAILIRNADLAFVNEAHLASILTAVSAIESHLRSEYPSQGKRLADLIDSADLEDDLKSELHAIRKFRNLWVHVEDPWDDQFFLENPEEVEVKFLEMTKRSLTALRRTVYSNPWI